MSELHSIPQLLEQFDAYRNKHPLQGHPESLYAPMEYILSLGGKRLRPVLCMAACQAFGGEVNRSLSAALGIEVFHNFSLVHDDIMDQAPVRRGQPTVHHRWDVNTAVLSGDAMLVEAYRLISDCPTDALPAVLASFNSMARQLCEGQRLDMDFEQRDSVTEDEYLAMIEGKTSVLIGCAMEIGALIAGADAAQAKAMYAFGLELGLAFQMKDDYLDCFGDPALTGKQSGGDILAGKHTLLAIHARTSAAERHASCMLLEGEQRVAMMRELYTECGADRYVLQRSEAYLESALRDLQNALPAGEARQELESLALQLVHRDY